MTQLAGIVFHDKVNIDFTRVDELRRSVMTKGHPGTFVREHCFFGCSGEFIKNNEQHEQTRAEPFIVFCNCRLDNRDYLHETLAGTSHPSLSDEQLIVAAYRRWGTDCFERLIGDWAIALWDGLRQLLLLARDFSGTRPLYYEITSSSLVWSSDLQLFLNKRPSSPKINHDYVYSYITSDPPPSRTPYSGINLVPPGSFLSIQAGTVAVRSFWELDTRTKLVYRNESDYSEQFYGILRDSVASRIQHSRPVWAELSGGLDSSSIVCMASNLLRQEGLSSNELYTLSYVCDQNHWDDEQSFMATVESVTISKHHHIHENSYRAFTFNKECSFLPYPVATPGRYLHTGKIIGYSSDCPLLSGHGGDSVMWSSSRLLPQLVDLLSKRRFFALHQELLRCSAKTMRTYWDLLFAEAVRPLLSIGPPRARSIPNWIKIDDFDLPSRDLASSRFGSTRDHSQRAQARMIQDAINACSIDPFIACCGITRAFPFLDRRLVQFMLAIPFEQKVQSGQTRFLHRNALRGILPDAVALRESKVGGMGFVCRAINREWHDLIGLFNNDARILNLKSIKHEQLLLALERARKGIEPHLRELIRVIAVETWLRGLENIPSHTASFIPNEFTAGQSLAGDRE